MTKTSSSEVFRRGLELFESVAKSRHGMSIEELAKARGMHRSSVYRYVGPLLQAGYVQKGEDGRFHLGPKILELSSLALEKLDVRNIAHPLLIQLSEATNATVHLARLDGSEVVYLDKVETHRSLPIVSRIGSRAPVYCTGLGKAVLAFLPAERLNGVVSQLHFKRFTKNTIASVKELLKDLSLVREQGYALDNEEHEENISCVAFPVFDLYEEPIAAVSVTAVAREINGKRSWYIEQLKQVAEGLSRTFGHNKEP